MMKMVQVCYDFFFMKNFIFSHKKGHILKEPKRREKPSLQMNFTPIFDLMAVFSSAFSCFCRHIDFLKLEKRVVNIYIFDSILP